MLDTECVGADWVKDSQGELSSRDRLNIYHNAYRIRLIDVLLDTFEHTAVYLGDNWFKQLASAYVQFHGSIYTNIGLYGLDFPKFLAKQLPDDLDVSELAEMDWKLRRVFDGPDSVAMTRSDIQQLASGESESRLHFIATMSVITQKFNTLDIWHAINQEQTPPKAQLQTEPVDVLIWRKGYSPHFRSLSVIESSAIAHLTNYRTLDDIGRALGLDYPDVDVATEFGLMLNRWLDDEILCKSE